ncbi:MAG TPA: Holliday junction resolvase RuvX [Rickettsiales bacterium]|nr:Holliday junction resolvase RuvX [Rickettsiales bacterium]
MIIKDYTLFHKIVPSQGKIMGLDIGTKRIGVAICDETRFLTTPKVIIARQSDMKDFAKIVDLIKENAIKAIVVGFPINMNGSLNEMSEFSRKFIIKLDGFLVGKLPIFPADERLTSFEADQYAKEISSRKGQKNHDDIAASVILQDFLEMVK